MEVSPKYQMQLIQNIEATLWDLYETSKYKNVLHYIKKWQKITGYGFHNDEECNFYIKFKEDGNIDLSETLHSINDGDLILKIAVDLGVETPGFIPVVPELRYSLETNYQTAFNSFQKASKSVYDDPGLAVGLANSTLESIIKHILKNPAINIIFKKGDTLYELTNLVLKEFCIYPGKDIPEEIQQIGSGLLKTSQGIEKMRSDKTIFHGKTDTDKVVNDSIYSYFVVNSVSTVGLFLIHFFESKYGISITKEDEKISIEDILF